MVSLDEVKEVFGQGVRVVSPIRCWDMATKEEILPPLEKSVASLLWLDLVFAFRGSDILVCTSAAAMEQAKGEKKAFLDEVVRYKHHDFDMHRSLLDWAD